MTSTARLTIVTILALALVFSCASALGNTLADAQAKTSSCWQAGHRAGGATDCKRVARRFTRAALDVARGPLDTTKCKRSHGHRYLWTCTTFMGSGAIVLGGLTRGGTLIAQEV